MNPRRLALCLSLVATIALRASASEPVVIDLWPGQAPGETGKVGEEKLTKKAGTEVVTSITNVTKPTLTLYRPSAETANGVAIVVCPGGGYNNLAWDHEGDQIGKWLNTLGVTAGVLKYRVPRRPGSPAGDPPIQALIDAQRALGLMRSKASDWGVDPKRVGMLGFSAGGHLAAWASTNFDKRAYDAIDAADKESCRPDFAVMIYPGGVLKRGSSELSPEIRITSQTPPCFFAHAGDDRVSPENSIRMYLALKAAGVPADLHIYASGGHGFGMRPSNKPCSTWPKRCEEWMIDQKILAAPKAGKE